MIENFIITFIDGITIFILWSKLSLEYKNKWKINLLIIAASSLTVALTEFNVYISMFSSYFLIIFLVKYFYNKNILRTIAEFFCIIIFIMFLQFSFIALCGLLNIHYKDNFTSNLVIQIVILLLCFIVNSIKEKCNDIVPSIISSKILIYFTVNILGYIILSKVIWDYDENLIINNIIEFSSVICFMLIINGAMFFYLMKIEQERKEALVQAQYSIVLENISDEIRQRQHDFKNHMCVIRGFADIVDENEIKEKLKNYIDSLHGSMANIEEIIFIDNTILSSIIYSKLNEAKKLGIKFMFNIENSLKNLLIKDYELVEILGVLIDNAFEALNDDYYRGEEKQVLIKSYYEEKKNVIEVINSGLITNIKDLNKIFHKGYSTKKGKNRGYGLYSVKKIVEHNGGEVQLSFEKGNTVFKLFIL